MESPLIQRVRIRNYRCFEDIEAPLGRLTVLIGQNDTGKSTFLEALALLHKTPGFSFRNPIDVRKMNTKLPVDILQYKNDKWTGFVFHPKKRVTQNLDIRKTAFHQLPSKGPSMICPGMDDSKGPPDLDQTGGNVPALVDYFLRRDRARFDSFVKDARQRIPGLKDIHVGTPGSNKRQLDLVVEDGVTLPADRSSVGVRIIIFFLALAHHPAPPKLLLIEEPESGVHPRRLEDIVKLFRGLTRGEHADHPVQIVLSTHSPYLLDAIDPSVDQVLIFRREKHGARSIEPADASRLAVFLDEFSLGEVWFNQEEDGLVSKAKGSVS